MQTKLLSFTKISCVATGTTFGMVFIGLPVYMLNKTLFNIGVHMFVDKKNQHRHKLVSYKDFLTKDKYIKTVDELRNGLLFRHFTKITGETFNIVLCSCGLLFGAGLLATHVSGTKSVIKQTYKYSQTVMKKSELIGISFMSGTYLSLLGLIGMHGFLISNVFGLSLYKNMNYTKQITYITPKYNSPPSSEI